MHYRTMVRSGDRLSALGYGCMRLPVFQDGRVDENSAARQIHYAIENGINYFDTAWPYHGGQSEGVLGRALQGGLRDKVKIATKLPSWLIHSREDMNRYLEKQLERLQTDRIDYYLLHALNGLTWSRLEERGVLDFVEESIAAGKILNAGFSFHGLLEDFKTIIDAYPWVFCQIQYNYLDRQYQAGEEGLNYAAQKDIGVIIMEPLRGGNLGLPAPPPAIAEIWAESAIKRTPVEWALHWIWNHPEVTMILSGMNNDDHIKENIAVAGKALPNTLTEEECALVHRSAQKYKELMQVDCTGCGYCMPCPENVLIPWIFEVYNKMHMFGNAEEAKFMYAARMSGIITGDKSGFASQCVQCGECIEKCPQAIAIPDVMETVVSEMEGPGLEEKLPLVRKMFRAGAD